MKRSERPLSIRCSSRRTDTPSNHTCPCTGNAFLKSHALYLGPRCGPRFVIPSRDAMSQQAFDCSRIIQGAISEVISFGGPAYRTFPASPCVLHQLVRGFAQKALPAVAPNQLPREVAEAWAGVALLVGGVIRLGFTGRAYECAPTGKDSYLPEGDIERREDQVELDQKISSRTLYQLHLAPCCTSWSSVLGAKRK